MFSEMMPVFKKIFTNNDFNPEKFFAPGRVNLIGEHTDHEGGYVFPCAITFGIYALASKGPEKKIRLYSMNFDGKLNSPFEISLEEIDKIDKSVKNDSRSWINYPLGVIIVLKKHGFKIDSGIDILYSGNLPDGAGLSSSAAIEVLTARIINELFGFGLNGVEIAKLSQESENSFVGVMCGIMDQFASSMGKENHAVLLNCSSMNYSYVPLELGTCKLVITNSNVPHSLKGSEYNLRRQQCEEALKDIRRVKDIKCLCDLSESEFDEVARYINDEVNLRRARHAVSENARTLRAADALRSGDLNAFGRFMNESHISLRDNYQVTVPELDVLAELAWSSAGVVGSRMTGGGFGGCTVSIVEQGEVENFVNSIDREYTKLTGRKADFYTVDTSDGARKM